ncbi:signal peptide-containing protein [Theileria equi strain WA]|uniref:Signal peptide-containing protein n=1 Tax=Theileria equi strain WA TaxID=1537102 RepID=L0AYM2_THEEQ|nr:signal peptide-containing protein [Theileria equi strain WA]AFZ79979.1 signal peptide-containing protein [Theileria equi strain WA]|eukprot:XP_004829645.1 signal peptide-containing protein [Theileria equi strain WA]
MRSFTRLILFASLCTGALGAPVKPEKILVNLDISKDVPDQMEYRSPRWDKDYALYQIKQYLKGIYIIGRVSDGEHIIMEGDSTCVDKYVDIIDRYNVYLVRILSKYANGNEYSCRIDEFRRTRGDPKYVQHYRTPVKLDVVKEERDAIIKLRSTMEPVIDRKPLHSETDGRNGKPLRITYAVDEDLKDQFVFGTIYFDGKLIVEEERSLLNREVVWDRSAENVTIDVLSWYNNGIKVNARYVLEAGKGFNLASEERTFIWAYYLHGCETEGSIVYTYDS